MIQCMKIESLSFVDTFGGIGGFHIAAEQACEDLGIKSDCVKSVEFDDDACETYKRNFGIDPKGDMTKIAPADFPDHDLLLGGFPCQPFSRNGKYYNHNKKTVADNEDRALLVTRLFDILTAKKPKFFVFENVKEILTIKNGDGSFVGDTVLANLKGCGYDVQVQVLDSVRFGLPQQRKRAYFVGTRLDLELGGVLFRFPEGNDIEISVEDILQKNVSERLLLKNLWKNRKIGQEEIKVEETIAIIRKKRPNSKYADLLEQECLKHGDAAISRFRALELAYQSGDWKQPLRKCDKIWPMAIIYGDTPSGLPRQQDKLYSIMGISPTIATFSTPAFDCKEGWRMLSPKECARLQGLPAKFKLPKSDATAYKQIGNAVSTNVAKAVIKRLLETAQKY